MQSDDIYETKKNALDNSTCMLYAAVIVKLDFRNKVTGKTKPVNCKLEQVFDIHV